MLFAFQILLGTWVCFSLQPNIHTRNRTVRLVLYFLNCVFRPLFWHTIRPLGRGCLICINLHMRTNYESSFWHVLVFFLSEHLFARTVKAPVLSDTTDYHDCCTWSQHCFRHVLSYFTIHYMMYTVTVDPAIKPGCCYSVWKDPTPTCGLLITRRSLLGPWSTSGFFHIHRTLRPIFCRLKYNSFKLPSHPSFPYCPPASTLL